MYIEFKDVSKVYFQGKIKITALDKINFGINKGELVVILGPSGAGKTTLLNILGGIDTASNGSIFVAGKDISKLNEHELTKYRRTDIGFVFQFYNLIQNLTALENVELAVQLCKEHLEPKEILTKVGLEKRLNNFPSELSGGEQQRVAIARSIAKNPKLLLADEPTGALDSDTSVQIMDLLKAISKDKLVIMVTHNPDLAKEYSSRIINIKDGVIISDTNPYDGKINTKEKKETVLNKSKKTKMSFLTALSLSFNNLMTKKARTILISIAGSIGIIGIALILKTGWYR